MKHLLHRCCLITSFVFLILFIGCAKPSIRQNDKEIKSYLLQQTPEGSSTNGVLAYIKEKKWKQSPDLDHTAATDTPLRKSNDSVIVIKLGSGHTFVEFLPLPTGVGTVTTHR